ncbi:hypothetical protein CCHR01_08541 [Colletotrichum chrysophilum]|uniref:Uncharacterized protein n=1 Tax=Colletotrichum chrysophilum TaxID=1836956 RepID=A0AAD9EEZ9_9PEZI|nr:hypothetical protein CCHR01_08541 [Colletotrichum chrysophilum]
MRRWRGAQMSQSVRKQRRHQRGTWKKGASATQEGMDCDGKRGHSWNGRLHVPDRDQWTTHVQGLRTHVQDNSAVSRFLGSFSSVYFGWLRPA